MVLGLFYGTDLLPASIIGITILIVGWQIYKTIKNKKI